MFQLIMLHNCWNKSQENHVSPFFNGQTYISNYRVASLLKKIVGVETNFKKNFVNVFECKKILN